MRFRIIFLLLAIVAFSVSTFAQVTISDKKVTYTRPKPIMEHKKRFTITYPKIKAATSMLSKKIEAVLSYEKAFDFKLSEEMHDVQWLSAATYDVSYNANNILSISLTIEGSGAYPDGSTRYIVVNTATGAKQTAAMVFSNLPGLASMVKKAQQKEKQETIAQIKKEEPDADEPELLFGDRNFEIADLDAFGLSNRGVTFHYDYGFPHVAQAYEPSGEFFFTWKELKPFIKSGGLLAPFVR